MVEISEITGYARRQSQRMIPIFVGLICLISLNSEVYGSEDPEVINFHVAKDGSDLWSGKLPEANAGKTDGPFASLEKAKESVIRLLDRFEGKIIINIHKGKYYLKAPLNFFRRDSGSDEAPVIWQAFDSDTVIITAARTLTNPVRVSSVEVLSLLSVEARKNVFTCNLKDQGLSGNLKFTNKGPAVQLTLGEKAFELAKYPDVDFLTISELEKVRFPADPTREYQKIFYKDKSQTDGKSEQNAFLFGYWYHDWSGEYQHILQWDSEKQEVVLLPPSHRYGYRKDQRFYFLNVLEELNRPGEWYADLKNDIIYYWPFPGHTEELPSLSGSVKSLFIFHNTNNIQVNGIIFESCYGPAIEIIGGENNQILCCEFRNIITDAIYINGGINNGVESCEIGYIGAGGIILKGGDRLSLTPGDNYVKNSHIHHYAQIQKTYKPAVYLLGAGNSISNNHIHDSPHLGIWLSGNDHIIQANEIHDLALETGDVGAIYTGRDWTFRGNRIMDNYIHHIKGCGQIGAHGIYLDDVASGFFISGNIFYCCDYGILVGGGRDNTINNNIFIACTPSVYIDNRGDRRAKMAISEGGSWQMHEKLKRLNFNKPPYSIKYPELARILDDNPGLPVNNVVSNNIVYQSIWLRYNPDKPYYWRDLVRVTQNLVNPEMSPVDQLSNLLDQLTTLMHQKKFEFKPINLESIGIQKNSE